MSCTPPAPAPSRAGVSFGSARPHCAGPMALPVPATARLRDVTWVFPFGVRALPESGRIPVHGFAPGLSDLHPRCPCPASPRTSPRRRKSWCCAISWRCYAVRSPGPGKGHIEGLWADRAVELDGVRSDIAMMRTPDGHSRLALTKYHTPAVSGAEPDNPRPNTLGLHHVMLAVDDIDDTIARLRTHGAELLGDVAQFESIFRLCYLRGPAGIIVALAEQIS
ncbi:VOC family protein [Actinoallomurus sp. CA-150999]|uniref:VOC family protein n=1 Tax=Actinoallomurus sp. CA-150999 TaxID=3239887 RepID=UPI003D92AEF1